MPYHKKENKIEEPRELVLDEFNLISIKLEKQIEEKYNAEWVDMFKRLTYELVTIGLNLKEACLICGINHSQLLKLMEKDPLIKQLIETKDLEYKRKLIKAVSKNAEVDDKQAQWLLSVKYPDEFNPRKGSASDSEKSNLLGLAIQFVQKSTDNNPLVRESGAKITMIQKNTSIEDMLK